MKREMATKPVIGLNCDISPPASRDRTGARMDLAWCYAEAVEKAGGVPVLLAPVEDPALIPAQLAPVRGVILVGGPDYDPALYGAKPHPSHSPLHPLRAAYDLKLAQAVLGRRLPLLAICGGLQLVNIVLGGSLEQHLPEAPGVTLPHDGQPGPFVHDVNVEPGSRLAAIAGTATLAVNSSHHQAVACPGRGLHVTARSTDGVIEALETDHPGDFLVAVQWHPERLMAYPRHLALFKALVEAAKPAS